MTLQLNTLALVLSLLFLTPGGQEVRSLISAQAVEREIAGGEMHTYQINLTAGQFVRFRLEQRAMDVALILTAPDGKQLSEVNLTGPNRLGEQESLSLEAPTTGSYRLTVRGTEARRGSYRLEAVVRAEATAEDRQRLKAEALLIEANELSKQAGGAAPQVIEKAQQALPLWRELGERHWTAFALSLIGTAYYDLNQYGKAMEPLEQALAIWREVKDRAGEGQTLRDLGRASGRQGRREKAIEYFQQALAIWREIGYRRNEGVALNNIGTASSNLGRSEKAIEYYKQSLVIAREVKERAGEASVLNQLGGMYHVLNQLEEAIEYHEQALAIFREVRDRQEVSVLYSLGSDYYGLSRYEKANEYWEQALAIARETKDREIEGSALNNLGRCNSDLGRHEKAFKYYEEARAVFREVRSRLNEGVALNNLANACSNLGRHEKAIEYGEQGLAIAREISQRALELGSLRNLGDAYFRLRRNEEAATYFEQALLIARELKEPSIKALPLHSLAAVEMNRGNLARARTLIEESLRITESQRTEALSPASRASFLASVQSSYRLYTDLLMRLHRAEPTKGFDALAVEVSERQRARSLLDLLAETRLDIRQGVDPTLLERERLLSRQLNDKAQQLAQANKPEQVDALKREISQLETDYERAQVTIRKANPHYAALTQPQPLKLKEIQAQLDADTLLLEYALGEERSYLWAITRDSLACYELPKEELIDKNARQVHELLSARSTTKRGESALERQERITRAEAALPAAAQALSQTVLAPVAAELGNKRLVIVADGALQYVPFAMLPEPAASTPTAGSRQPVAGNTTSSSRPPTTDHRPLIVGHEVVSLPSASALAIQRTELAGRQPAPKLLAVIADPVFDRTDARFNIAASDVAVIADPQVRSFNDERSLEHLAEKSDGKSATATRRLVIPRLPFTRQEATRLLALTPKSASFAAIDFQASTTTVQTGGLSQYRYVHFATHGVVDTEKPWNSALVLSMVDAEGKAQDGFLRLKDIYNLKLSAELVVLSACQTGIGKEIKGEGMEALTRGFMYAGAARVVVSLWNVNDKATAELMTKFYEKMLKEGVRPATALRAAQVEMWKQRQWQSPYYWAAFTLQGEWR